LARDTRLLIFQAAALAFWIACVVFLLAPRDGPQSKFESGQPFQPKYTPARSL
jgi:hypothetical protein